MKTLALSPLLLLLVPFYACAPGPETASSDTGGETGLGTPPLRAESTLLAVHDSVEAQSVGNSLGTLLPFYADDAVQLVPTEPPFVGKAAIQARYEDWGDFRFLDRQFEVVSADVQEGFGFVWGIVTQQFKMTPEAEPGENAVTFLRVFRKQADGSWKISLETWDYR